MVVGRIGVGSICDLWVRFVICGRGVLWVCFVMVVGLLVMLCWCLGGGCAAFFFIFILFVIGDFVWSGLRKKIGDFGFFFSLLWIGGGGVGCGCGCGCG